METRQSEVPAEHLSSRNAAEIEEYLAVVRREHSRFVEALSLASAHLGRQSVQLAAASSMQVQLTRQFLDAQRSILQLRAETDREIDAIGETPHDVDGRVDSDDLVSYSRRRSQLTMLLDEWWLDENELRRVVLARARHAVQRYLAELAAGADSAIGALPVTLPARSAQLLAQLDAAEPADLCGLLDALIDSLDDRPLASRVETDPCAQSTIAPAERPLRELRFIEGAAADGFGEFWMHDPAPVETPRRWRRRLVAEAVAPTVVVATMLTAAMAWIG